MKSSRPGPKSHAHRTYQKRDKSRSQGRQTPFETSRTRSQDNQRLQRNQPSPDKPPRASGGAIRNYNSYPCKILYNDEETIQTYNPLIVSAKPVTIEICILASLAIHEVVELRRIYENSTQVVRHHMNQYTFLSSARAGLNAKLGYEIVNIPQSLNDLLIMADIALKKYIDDAVERLNTLNISSEFL
jgi:hypothetical protein